jgi:NAD(P)-dependent dehydrogenase (short-subunit alcohol dehydrogenase family)
LRLKNKVAIVTGGGSGQGRAIAHLFAREGGRVVVADVNAPAAEETAQQVRDIGGSVMLVVPTDVSDENDVKHLVAATIQEFDALDILVNCAGRLGPLGKETADQLTLEEWNTTLGVNLLGPWLCIKYTAPEMKKRGGGVIINVASTAGLRPFPGAAPYCVSKAGLLMLTRTVALEYAPYNIRVTAICPGHVDTPMMDTVIADMEAQGILDARDKVHTQSNPMKRLGRPEEVARVALYLAGDDSSFITGSFVLADGGYMAG